MYIPQLGKTLLNCPSYINNGYTFLSVAERNRTREGCNDQFLGHRPGMTMGIS